ncbi:MAG: hypothetical protein GY856_41770 [bacterium]|nr:hypothetical protein [bacterium]
MPFDIDPARVDAGETHFEQILDRAEQALDSTVAVWDFANQLTRMLRLNQDTIKPSAKVLGAQSSVRQRVDYRAVAWGLVQNASIVLLSRICAGSSIALGAPASSRLVGFSPRMDASRLKGGCRCGRRGDERPCLPGLW